MGLMRQADSVKNVLSIAETKSVKTSQTGLLDKIKLSSEYDRLFSLFSDFCRNEGFSRAMLLACTDDLVQSIIALGFDLTTARRCVFNKTSITGLFSEEVACFSGTRMTFFSSFFSSHEWSSIKEIFTFKINITDSDAVFVLCATSLLDTSRGEILKKQFNISALKEKLIDCNEVCKALSRNIAINQSPEAILSKIQCALQNGKKANLIRIDLSSIFPDTAEYNQDFTMQTLHSSIVHQISRKVGSTNILNQISIQDLRIALFTSQNLDNDLYKMLLLGNLEELFGITRIARIKIYFLGDANQTPDVIRNFILGES